MFLNKLKRCPTRSQYIPELDGLRFLAILGVVIFHARAYFISSPEIDDISSIDFDQWFEYGIGKGYFGVNLFFIISGFMIAAPFAKYYLLDAKKPKLGSFFLRRFKRIEIPYFIALLGGYITLILYNGHSLTQDLHHLWQGATYLHGILQPDHLNPLLPPAWTLELEIQFYLLAPLLCFIYRLKSQAFRVSLFVIGILILPLLLNHLYDLTGSVFFSKNFILLNLPYFFAGMLGLDLYLTRKQQKHPLVWDVIGVITALSSLAMLSHWQLKPYQPIVLGLFFMSALWSHWLKKFLSLSLLTIFGGISYSIYLFHGPILHLCTHDSPISPKSDTVWLNQLNLVGVTLLVFILCIPLYLLVERPFMTKKRPGSDTHKQN